MKKELLFVPDAYTSASKERLYNRSDSAAAWDHFTKTGRVEDYLAYCQAEGRIETLKE